MVEFLITAILNYTLTVIHCHHAFWNLYVSIYIFLIDAYLSNDNYRRNDVDPEFEEEMDNIQQLCHR